MLNKNNITASTTRGFAHILVLVFVILGIGALGYFSWKGGYINFNPQSQNQSDTDSSQKIDTDEVSDWKTYTNGEISLQHPPSYTINLNSSSFKQGDLFTIEAPSPAHKTSGVNATSVQVLTVANPTQTDLSLDKWFEESTHGTKDPDFSKFEIKQNNRFGGHKTIQKDFCGTLGCWTYLFTKYGNNIHTLSYPSPENYKDLYKTREDILELQGNIDQILSTFQFIDNGISYSDWKAYNFEKGKLTFKAPSNLYVNLEQQNPDDLGFTLFIQNSDSNHPLRSGVEAYQLYGLYQKNNFYTFTQKDIEDHKVDFEPSSIKYVTVDGYKAIRGQYKGERNRYVTEFIKDGGLFTLYTSEPLPENEALSNQIISTFKFTD